MINLQELKNIAEPVKGYKLMCKLLREQEKGGKSKQLQLLEWKRYFDYTYEKPYFTIHKIYDEPLLKISNRGKTETSRSIKCFSQFIPNRELWHKKGVYSITFNQNIYVGSTNSGFRKRFLQHKSKYNKFITRQMIEQGAVFDILYIANNISDKELRQIEQIYYEKFNNNKEWNVVNSQNPFKRTLYKFNKINKDKKTKKKYKTIRILEDNYQPAMDLLIEHNLMY